MKLEQQLCRQLAAIVEAEGLEYVAAEVMGRGPGTILRLVIDGPHGVNLDQCAAISREVSAFLDVEDPIRHGYTLEVSSPGLDRKLYSREDYDRFTGHRVKVRMQPSHREHRIVIGELLGVEDGAARIRCDTTEVLCLPLEEIFETRLEVDWKQILKEGKSRQ